MTLRRRCSESRRYVTKDGSEIRELMHPDDNHVHNLSLAGATGSAPLHILCCCGRAYSHADTTLA